MQISLSPKYKIFPTLLIFSALALMASVTSILLLGELMLPIASAALSAVFLLERGRARIFSIAVPVVVLAADILARGAMSYLAPEIIFLAIILAVCFLRTAKSECAFWLSLTVSVFVIVSMVLAAYSATKTLTLDAFVDFYLDMYETVEEAFTAGFSEISVIFGVTSDKDDTATASAILRAMASVLPSVAIIFAFAISGLALKFQSIMLKAVSDDATRKAVSSWRFMLTSTVYWAFWIALSLNFILNIFGAVGSFAIIVANIYNVLLYVFAYVGFGIVLAMLSALFKSRPLAVLALIGTLVLFSGLAIELIAYFGAASVFFGRVKPGVDK